MTSTTTKNLIVQTKGLCKTYGPTKAVLDLEFSLFEGEFVGLVGHNGAGKSTLIKMLASQILPSNGEVLFSNCSDDITERKKLVGYVPEFPEMFDYLTGAEMLEYISHIRNVSDWQWALEFIGLGEAEDRYIREYSQGMRRKIAIACAVVAKPKLIILDESLNGLDPPSTKRVLSVLEDLRRENGSCILLSTHILDTLEKVSSRVVMMKSGKIIREVQPSEIDSLYEFF